MAAMTGAMARAAVRAAALGAARSSGTRLADSVPRAILDFGSSPIDRQLVLSAQFLLKELPVRLAHRVAELENLPYGLSSKAQVLKVRDWYVESFRELRAFPGIKNGAEEAAFSDLLRNIYRRHGLVMRPRQ
ncbi:pyruvate dehydrogenase kinase [Monoraphidium neglectum]|uniref:Protein-serine/threonine kinase n=1 Tax=Monoraphidium neglectum TaxID=145388 RepID=A0A0D2MZX2_9CHLO|nr:pyruvate dehydrogenase kinase [Monoraphidium neglectum]KIZ05852.1 pyruvate dehydrogenase kinase [Monoraphidium neglectum]|eukprot:XP_013904871.1 pyruvate dehydrogenase kinase [Monoraphidium neglectum]